MGPTRKIEVPGTEQSYGTKQVAFNIMNPFLTGLLLTNTTYAVRKCFELILCKIKPMKTIKPFKKNKILLAFYNF